VNLDNLAYPIESLIARLVVRKLLAAGYSIEVQNGEETVLQPSRTYRTILEAMATTDEEHLIARKPRAQASFVTLYYGNGEDVIHDFGVTLEPVLDGANAEAAYKAAREAMDKAHPAFEGVRRPR
jgi:hypothetical protein